MKVGKCQHNETPSYVDYAHNYKINLMYTFILFRCLSLIWIGFSNRENQNQYLWDNGQVVEEDELNFGGKNFDLIHKG